jgi:homoserine dehydrogenase
MLLRTDAPACRLDVVVVGVADSKGIAVSPTGLSCEVVSRCKALRGSVAALEGGAGRPGTIFDLMTLVAYEVLFEATSVNLKDGQPALSTVVQALKGGAHVVLTNKAPLALAYQVLPCVFSPHPFSARR